MSQIEGDLRSQLLALTTELSDPFAKALATFVREVSRRGGQGASGDELLDQFEESEAFQKSTQQHIEHLRKEYDQLAKEGKLESLAFRDIPQPKPTLRVMVLQKGVTQKELAKKTGMDAAMVSRVLKDPHRSKVSTLLRIAHALGVGLGDLDLEHS